MALIDRSDEGYMKLALRLARQAAAAGEVPVGAVVVTGERVLARAANQVELLRDGTAHAEMLALTMAAAALGDWRLQPCTLYVTKEPCAMCAGAMVNCKLGRLVYGAPDTRSGAAGGALNITAFPGMLHQVDVRGGVLAEECLQVLQEFFQERRAAGHAERQLGPDRPPTGRRPEADPPREPQLGPDRPPEEEDHP